MASRNGAMSAATGTQPSYVLGSDSEEIARLDAQADSVAQPTELLLRSAGIGTGMRVLDLGTGLGHVALAAGGLVGEAGSVVGIDQSPRLLAIAEQRRATAGAENVRFCEADVRTFAADEPFDAVVGRLILFHLPDATEVIRHHGRSLTPGGRFVAIDFDLGTARAEPDVPLVSQAARWIIDAFAAAGANPVIGARLGPLLRAAGLRDITTFGLQRYLAPDDPAGPAQIAGVVRSLAPTILTAGIAGEAELGLDTLAQRLGDAVRAADAVVLVPGLVGAWGDLAG
jgi:SAM-dependent methyltransferase